MLQIANIDSSIQRPSTEAVSQKMWRDPLSLPHFARSRLLKPCLLGSFVQQPLNLPGRDMALISALEDESAVPALEMGIQGSYDRLGEDRGTSFTALAVHYMQVSSGAIQVFYLQGGHFRDTQATASHQPEKGSLSQGRCRSHQPVPFVQGEKVLGMHVIVHDVIIYQFHDLC